MLGGQLCCVIHHVGLYFTGDNNGGLFGRERQHCLGLLIIVDSNMSEWDEWDRQQCPSGIDSNMSEWDDILYEWDHTLLRVLTMIPSESLITALFPESERWLSTLVMLMLKRGAREVNVSLLQKVVSFVGLFCKRDS